MSSKLKAMQLLVFIMSFFMFFVSDVSAATKTTEVNKNEMTCIFCNGDPEIYKQEQQFASRIKIIKQILGKSVDEIALAATVLHKENARQAIASRYDENFKAGQYKASLSTLFKKQEFGKPENATQEKKIGMDSGVAGKQIDLLNAAAIIMADSSGWTGAYNEEKYQKALAGDKLFGNNSGGAAADFANAVFCKAGAVADGAFTIGNITYQFLTGQDILTEIERSSARWNNMARICENGYVGGVYNLTKDVIPNDTNRQLQKEEIAKEIIDLIHYYKLVVGKEDQCVVQTSSGDFAGWKQYDSQWGSLAVGDGGTMSSIGCLVTSVAIQMARSGTQITNVDGGFNPGSFVKVLNNNGGFVSGGNYTWSGHSGIAPNWQFAGKGSANTSNTADLAKKLSAELSDGAEGGKYQKFIVLFTSSNKYPGHWVAVDSVSGDNVTIFDPAESGTTLDENYSSWHVGEYGIFYATDVPVGKTGSSTATTEVVTPADPSSFNDRIKDGFKHGDLPKDKVKYIMMHDTESGTDDAEAIINAWGNGPVASHFVVARDGTIYQTTPINKIAHHAGWGPSGSNSAFGISQERDDMVGADTNGQDYAMNAWSIGIEIVHDHDGSEYPEEQLKALDSLVAYLDDELDHEAEITDHKEWTGNSEQTRVKKQGQVKQDVDSSFPLSQYQTSRTHDGNKNEVCDDVDNLLQEFIDFLAANEGTATCNYHGQGEGTGYAVTTLADGAGPTTALGITHFNDGVANDVGYTNFLTDLYAGCTDKSMIDKMLPEVIEYIATTYTDNQAEEAGVTLTPAERYALTSVNYGGVVLAKPIIAAIKEYGKDSEQVYRAFQNSFTNMTYANGLMRRRMSEYEAFMTGNFKAESTKYLGWDNIYGNAISMSKSEAMSHWPSSRDE